ncbi:hypothetical protein [Salinibaculum rarum]|uniref:hypothetical protein n=1 Tax=Salinibaculum rarum TaxID=3058903 RepID=UPI00265D7163|nr:hypothetical protein [Salinibaculum sp. KK48]
MTGIMAHPTETSSPDLEELTQQARAVLQDADRPLRTREVNEEIDARHLRETKAVLRRLIDRGAIKTHPGFKYALSASAREGDA